jgi:hypothetical protein
MPPEPTDPIGLGYGPGDRANIIGDGRPPPSLAATTAAAAGAAGSLRVVDQATPPGLVETIVGDLTGFILGG